MNFHKAVLFVLYSGSILFALAIAYKGFSYYTLPLELRPHSPLHDSMKPAGIWGHGLGILGSLMMLLLFLYSARKRYLFGLRFGKIRYWLNIHIFFGIMGPIFVTLHTSFKFGGIVTVCYFSMIAVMLSGFIGRYLYVQIPRTLSGDELSMQEMEEKNKIMNRLLVEKYKINALILNHIQSVSGLKEGRKLQGFSIVLQIMKNDLMRPLKMRALKKLIHGQNKNIPSKEIYNLAALVKQKSLLMRKMAFLSSIQPLFHIWHIVHKPFAYVMIIIMFLHIAVTLLFGYRWIF
ncbi:MAG: hypothetical protein ACE5HI_03150 [bacterium]